MEATIDTQMTIRRGLSVIILSMVKHIEDLINGRLQAYVIWKKMIFCKFQPSA